MIWSIFLITMSHHGESILVLFTKEKVMVEFIKIILFTIIIKKRSTSCKIILRANIIKMIKNNVSFL